MVGESEMAEGLIGLKDMRSGEQLRVTLEEVVKMLG
jgi:histidyl-tRNA synthetase